MEAWKHFNPVRIIAKHDARKELPQILSHYIDMSALLSPRSDTPQAVVLYSLLLVTSAGMIRRKTADLLMADIPATWSVCEISPEPDLDILDQKIQELREQEKSKGKILAVIALGGGSVMDSAKAIACGLQTEFKTPLHAWLRDKKELNVSPLPLILLPTNAGTGAEITPFATIWDNKNKKKCSLAGEACFAKVALLDPSLTLSLPWVDTLYGALDAFSHALETLWNTTATPMSLSCAQTALSLVMENLPIIEEFPQNIEARSKVQEAACISGMAISQSHSSISHSISYPLTLHYKVPHGLSCSAFLLPIFDLVEKENAWKIPLDNDFKKQLRDFLKKYAPHKLVRDFCNKEQTQNLVHEMFTPERAGTFVLNLNGNDIKNILENGFTS